MEKALEQTRAAISADSRRATVVGDAQFWRLRRDDFREYNTEANDRLAACWSSLTDKWTLSGPEESQRNFRSLATLAAQGLRSPHGGERWALWLDELRHEGRNCTESEATAALSQDALANALRMSAEALWHSDSYLGARYRRLRGRMEGKKAVKAMAHYLAC